MQAIADRIPETEMLMINSARSLVAIGLEDVSARISRCKGDKESRGRSPARGG